MTEDIDLNGRRTEIKMWLFKFVFSCIFFRTGLQYIHIDTQANTTHRTLNNSNKEVLNMIKD